MVRGKRTNGSKMEEKGAQNKLPAFFKPFLPDLSTNRLKIPYAYTKWMQGKLPSKAFLRDRYGNIWSVVIASVESNNFFTDGWTKFVKDNSVELGDFLVFQYDGHHVFDVKLLGHDVCDKKGVGSLVFRVKEEEEENNGIEFIEEEQREIDYDDDYDVEYINEEEEETESDEEIYETQEEQLANHSNKRAVDHHSKTSDKGSSRKIITIWRGGNNKARQQNQYRRKKAIDPYGFDIFRSGIASQPKNPYFVTRVRAHRKDELFIPADVIKDNKLDIPKETILRDPEGREWNTYRRTWKDGRLWYCGGWRSLCKLNLVGENDICICEFVKCRNKGLFIQVQIVQISADHDVLKGN